MRCHLAIDIGASSGRHIVGWQTSEGIQTKEVYRFPNGVHHEGGHLVWDVAALVSEVKRGIACAKECFSDIVSLSIDTWGVDYVLLKGEQEVLPVYAYRDHRTENVIPQVHTVISFDELYRKTGCQFQPFTTIYQLADDLQRDRLLGVTDILMMPSYLLYKLCGTKVWEYTSATTTGLINACTGEFDMDIIEAMNLPKHLFHPASQPGTVIGTYEGIKCVLCASHDTASAVEAIPMEENAPYISSGTWSLLGVKTEKPITDESSQRANYSNEGGINYNRYQKNIMGMWLVNELRREMCPDTSFGDIVSVAENSLCDILVDANAPQFLSPTSMKAAFDEATGHALTELGDYFRCAYRSLALSYRDALQELETNTGYSYDRLYIVGGGARNQFLNRLTEETTGKKVIALPIEATAIGNLLVQMRT